MKFLHAFVEEDPVEMVTLSNRDSLPDSLGETAESLSGKGDSAMHKPKDDQLTLGGIASREGRDHTLVIRRLNRCRIEWVPFRLRLNSGKELIFAPDCFKSMLTSDAKGRPILRDSIAKRGGRWVLSAVRDTRYYRARGANYAEAVRNMYALIQWREAQDADAEEAFGNEESAEREEVSHA